MRQANPRMKERSRKMERQNLGLLNWKTDGTIVVREVYILLSVMCPLRAVSIRLCTK
jgi:hypothetical protein